MLTLRVSMTNHSYSYGLLSFCTQVDSYTSCFVYKMVISYTNCCPHKM